MSDKIEPISPIPSDLKIAPESRNRPKHIPFSKRDKDFKEKLDKAIEERINKTLDK
jgi:hypothetical protein